MIQSLKRRLAGLEVNKGIGKAHVERIIWSSGLMSAEDRYRETRYLAVGDEWLRKLEDGELLPDVDGGSVPWLLKGEESL